MLIYETLYCLSDVLGKKYLNMYMDGLYLFLFKIGIIGLISLLLIDFVGYYFEFNYHSIIITFLKLKIGNFLFNLLCYFIFNISLWLTIYYFSPSHYIILNTLSNFIEVFIIYLTKENAFTKGQLITFIILYPILFISALVFNEIIILDFWGLSFNTKLYIAERGSITREDDNDNDSDSEIEEFEIYNEDDDDINNDNKENDGKNLIDTLN